MKHLLAALAVSGGLTAAGCQHGSEVGGSTATSGGERSNAVAPDGQMSGANPVLETIRSAVGDCTGPFVLVVRFEVKPESLAGVERAIALAIAGTRKEPGAILYDFSRSTDSPTRFVLLEKWRSINDLARHFELAHTKQLLATIGEQKTEQIGLAVYLPVEEPLEPGPGRAGY